MWYRHAFFEAPIATGRFDADGNEIVLIGGKELSLVMWPGPLGPFPTSDAVECNRETVLFPMGDTT